MPLARYFLFTTAVLFAMLVCADALLPKMPLAESVEPHHPSIRLYSDERWPERVVFDTSAQAINSGQPAVADANRIPAPAVADKPAKTREAPAEMDRSVNSREAFAELTQNSRSKPQSADSKKLGRENQRKIAGRHASERLRLVWRQPSYGWSSIWW